MSSNIMYSTKNHRTDWVSQFGLYRYESAATPRTIEYDRRRLIMKITFLLSITLFLALLIFYIVIYMSNYNEMDRMIFFSQLESDSLEKSHRNPLTTVFYPDDHISTYQRMMSSTTPMSAEKMVSNETILTSIVMGKSMKGAPTIVTWYPPNHKRQYSSVFRNRGNDFITKVAITKTTTPTSPTKYREMRPQQRMFFPIGGDNDDDDDDDNDSGGDFEYVDSYQNVNSIQDILNQNENENVNDDGLIRPSMPFSRTMKVEGIYRREKKKSDQLATMETQQIEQIASANDKNTMYNLQKKFDPFLKLRPSSPSDVNLLASNMLKFNQYTHHKPRPVTTPMAMNKFPDNNYYNGQDPNIIYHQIISASNQIQNPPIRTARNEKPSKNNKPFSLMLDVYPMPEDESPAASSTRITQPQNQYRRPIYPMNSHAINHNAQYSKDNAFYNHLKFPQLQTYPYNRAPYVVTHNHKDGLMRHYASQRMNTNIYRPVLKPPQTFPSHEMKPNDEAPSQITVHLNLYPDRKKYQSRNVEILNTDTTSSHSNGARNDISIWKRLEQRENATTTKLESIDPPTVQPFLQPIKHSVHQSKPYIPPFSAIKINTLQQTFGVNDTGSLVLSDQPDKSIEYDLAIFDSKKINPHIKLTAPTAANSMIATATPFFNDIESTVSTDLTNTLAPTTFGPFETTMSSSTSPYNHLSFVSTMIPLETTAATATATTATMATLATATNIPNESKSVQPTTIHNNIIHFPNER